MSSLRPYIAINATALFKKNKTGVEWYSWQLLKYLSKEWKESDPPVVLFAPRDSVETGHAPSLHARKKNWYPKPLKGKYFWTQYHLLRFLHQYPPVLLFSPSYVAPLFLNKNIPKLTVVHGLEGEYYPEVNSIKNILLEHFIYTPALRKSTHILAVSEHTKKDLHHFYNIPLSRIDTVLSGPGTLDDDYTPRPALAGHPSQEGIKFLFIGGVNERKNLEMALRIFHSLKKQTKKNINLFIAGNLKKPNPIIKKLIRKGGKNIIRLGYISEKEKKKQLLSALFLFYPSFYEGFGFPVLEAQAFGVVPIVLKNSGLAEIGGEGIIELDPSSKNKFLAIELAKVINNPLKYHELQEFGLDNVKRFSWQKCAKATRKLILKTLINSN